MVEINCKVGLRDRGRECHEERNWRTERKTKVGEVSVQRDITRVTTLHVDALSRT